MWHCWSWRGGWRAEGPREPWRVSDPWRQWCLIWGNTGGAREIEELEIDIDGQKCLAWLLGIHSQLIQCSIGFSPAGVIRLEAGVVMFVWRWRWSCWIWWVFALDANTPSSIHSSMQNTQHRIRLYHGYSRVQCIASQDQYYFWSDNTCLSARDLCPIWPCAFLLILSHVERVLWPQRAEIEYLFSWLFSPISLSFFSLVNSCWLFYIQFSASYRAPMPCAPANSHYYWDYSNWNPRHRQINSTRPYSQVY